MVTATAPAQSHGAWLREWTGLEDSVIDAVEARCYHCAGPAGKSGSR